MRARRLNAVSLGRDSWRNVVITVVTTESSVNCVEQTVIVPSAQDALPRSVAYRPCAATTALLSLAHLARMKDHILVTARFANTPKAIPWSGSAQSNVPA